MSETAKYRKELSKYCVGYGVDLGYGGDPIIESAITVDLPIPYTILGKHPLNIGGDATNLRWLKENSLDYVYSSHLLEDFENTKEIIEEWSRILKRRGKLVLLLPDQKRYEESCRERNEHPNPSHKIKEFSLDYIKNIIREIPYLKIISEKDYVGDYNFSLVAEKVEHAPPADCNKCKKINSELDKVKQVLSLRDEELKNIRSSLRWKIPNYFYKLFWKTIGKF